MLHRSSSLLRTFATCTPSPRLRLHLPPPRHFATRWMLLMMMRRVWCTPQQSARARAHGEFVFNEHTATHPCVVFKPRSLQEQRRRRRPAMTTKPKTHCRRCCRHQWKPVRIAVQCGRVVKYGGRVCAGSCLVKRETFVLASAQCGCCCCCCSVAETRCIRVHALTKD